MDNASKLALAASLSITAAPSLAQTTAHLLVTLIRVGDLPNRATSRFEEIIG